MRPHPPLGTFSPKRRINKHSSIKTSDGTAQIRTYKLALHVPKHILQSLVPEKIKKQCTNSHKALTSLIVPKGSLWLEVGFAFEVANTLNKILPVKIKR